MTKILYLLLFLAFPLQADATEVFGNDSFQLAKSVKLGRSPDVLTTDGFVRYMGSGGNGPVDDGAERKFCDTGCVKCDLSTGTCKQCSPGSAPSGKGCVACQAGYFSSSNGTVCKQCPLGAYSDKVGADVCTSCPIGEYADTKGSTSCTPCPAGTYADAMGKTSCKACPSGKYSPAAGASHCYNCPANATCTAVDFTCNSGYGKDRTNSRCDACPTGCTACNHPGNGFQTSCTVCASGYDLVEERACYGTLSVQGSTEVCSGSWYNVSRCQKKITSCPAGQYLTNGTCQLCSPGEYSASGATSCSLCPIGSINPLDGAEGCSSCQGSGYAPSTGMTECKSCPDHATCTASDFTCGSGYGKSVSGVSCEACPTGCTACVGQHNGYQGACSACASGYELVDMRKCNGTISVQGSSEVCSSSWYTVKACQKKACEAGYYMNNGSCSMCTAGSFAPAGASSCTPCGQGSASEAGADVCASCSSWISNCNECSSTTHCTVCQSGYTQVGGKCQKSSSSSSSGNCKPKVEQHWNASCVKCTQCNTANGLCLGSASSCGTKGQDAACYSNSECQTGWCLPGGTSGRSGRYVQGSHCS